MTAIEREGYEAEIKRQRQRRQCHRATPNPTMGHSATGPLAAGKAVIVAKPIARRPVVAKPHDAQALAGRGALIDRAHLTSGATAKL
jgi:hypothetical protein